MSLKKIAVCGTILAAAVVATALAAKADTVVHYTFDDLGDVGTVLANGSTIQNKANPVTHAATVYGMNGANKYTASIRYPYVTNGVPETLRVLDPVGNTIASAVDKGLRFPCVNAGSNGAMLEIPNDVSLRPSAFTVEMFVRINPSGYGHQMIACQPSTTDERYGWAIQCKQYSTTSIHLLFDRENDTQADSGIGKADILSDYKWHHIALTVAPHATDSDKSVVRFYIDYKSVYDYPDAPYVPILSDSADCPVQIGGTTVTGQNFMGEIGEFRFSSGVLDPGEFLRPQNAAIDKDVVLYYDFEDGDVYAGNFAYSTGDVLNKASPIMPGTFQTVVGTDSKTYPFIDEASPAYRVLPSADVKSDKSMDSMHALRNGSYRVVGSNTSRLKCTPAYEDLFRDAGDFTVEMFYKCGEKEYSDETIVQQAKLLTIPGQFVVGFASSAAQMTPILVTSGGNVCFSSGTRVDDGAWHHVAVVVSQSGGQKTFSWYHDGTLYANQHKTFSGTVSSMTAGALWHIGTNNGGRAFDGWIDSLRVTMRALEPSEFLQKERAPGLTLVVW